MSKEDPEYIQMLERSMKPMRRLLKFKADGERREFLVKYKVDGKFKGGTDG